MCLVTNVPQIRIAEKDIVVYKKIRYRGIFKRPRSFIESFKWRRLTLNPIVNLKPFKCIDSFYMVAEGYHSFLKPENKPRSLSSKKSVTANAVFIIPKGTEYIAGWWNDEQDIKNYVSAQLVYIGRYNSLLTKLVLKTYYNL